MSRNDYIEALEENKETHFYYQRAKELERDFETKAYVKEGVVRWKSNNEVPPKEILELWHYLKKPFDYENSSELRNAERDAFLEEYRKRQQNKVYSQEELYEMTAAFGKGATVVDVISGRKIKL